MSSPTPPTALQEVRILALDVGEKRIGLAVSDPLGITAQGLEVLIRRTPEADLARLQQSAFLHRYVWCVRTMLDLGSMTKAACLLLGEHDFSSFRASGCGAKHPVRTVHSLDISRPGEIDFMTAPIEGDFIKIRIEANAFLRHMVRNIAGTLVEVGRGRISLEGFSRILQSSDRTIAGPTAPAQGLFLEKIIY